MAETIEGLEELYKTLSKLDDLAATKALNRGMTRGAAALRSQARRNAKAVDDPSTPEAIYKNITSRRWRVKKGKKYLGASIGVMAGDGKGGDTYYWRFLEFGTKKMAAKPFLEPALKQSKEKVLTSIKEGAEKAVADAIAKRS